MVNLDKLHTYQSFDIDKRRKIKAMMLKIRESTQSQIDLYEKNILRLFRDRKDMIDKFLHNEITLEQVQYNFKQTDKYVKAFMNGGK